VEFGGGAPPPPPHPGHFHPPSHLPPPAGLVESHDQRAFYRWATVSLVNFIASQNWVVPSFFT
jgi:hypothetical protein